MSVDHVLRAIATLTCMYTAGLFITLTSIATVNAAGYSPYCGREHCAMASMDRQYITPAAVRLDVVRTKAVMTARLEAQKI